MRKARRMQRELPKLLEYLLQDAPAFFSLKLRNEQLAGAPGTMPTAPAGARVVVGRQSGNLARSYYEIVRQGMQTLIRSAPGVAPYAHQVAQTVFTRQGRDYLHVTKFYYEDLIVKKAGEVLEKWADAVSNNKPYLYRNPYPTS